MAAARNFIRSLKERGRSGQNVFRAAERQRRRLDVRSSQLTTGSSVSICWATACTIASRGQSALSVHA